MRPILYRKDSQLNISKSVIKTQYINLEKPKWLKLCELNIARKTKRRCRGGKHKLGKITTTINVNNNAATVNHVNYENLRKVLIHVHAPTK